MFGDRKHLRKCFLRALEKTHDDIETISSMWLQFEREEGVFIFYYLLGATGTSLSLNVGPSVFLSVGRLQLSRLVGGCPFIKRKPIHATS